MSLCLLVGLTLVGCGDDTTSPELDGDTDAQGESSSGATPDDPSSPSTSDDSTTGDVPDGTSTSDEPDGDDASSGGADESTGGSTGEEPEPGIDVDAYRITWTSAESNVTRIYTSNADFSDAITLNPAGVDGVQMEEFHQRPRMHSDGRTLGFVWGTSLLASDILTAETHPLTYDGSPVRRFAWAPTAREVAWIDDSLRFRRGAWDASDTSQIRNLEGDGRAPESIQFAWNSLGDRLWVSSRPGGSSNSVAWVVDSDGSDYGVVADTGTPNSNVTHIKWAPDGESMSMIADLDPGTPGREMYMGEREGLEMVSHDGGQLSKYWTSADGSRLMYFSDDGLFSLNDDATDLTLIDAGTPQSSDLVQATVNDDGAFGAWVSEGALTAVDTTLHTPLQLESDGVDWSTVQFIPGGVFLAYIKEDAGQRELWMVDGDGIHRMSHELDDGANVDDFQWFQGGLMYTVLDADERPTLHHTDLGETPLFIPTPTEWAIRAYPSPDENLLIVRLTDFDFESGRLCAFDVRDVTDRVALGCEDIDINHTVSVFVTQPDR